MTRTKTLASTLILLSLPPAAALAQTLSLSSPPPSSDLARELPRIKRVYIDRFTGGETAAQLRELVISSLQSARLFIITENEQKADAILRGGAEDLIFTDQFQSADSVIARLSVGTGIGTTSKNQSRSASDRAGSSGVTVGEHESSNIKERKHEAFATVRLVNKEGDVIWSTTQESQGGKFRSASADVADKIAKQMTLDARTMQAAGKP